MPTERARLPHEERTAREPRDPNVHSVILSDIEEVNSNIRLYKLSAKDQNQGIRFLPGQWLDVFVPGIPKAGGFTITSSPSANKLVELAVQKSPDNPPAAWLWRPKKEILGEELTVRVGGSFVWPPPGVDIENVDHALFIAGGIGINPLMSMVTAIHERLSLHDQHNPAKVNILYSTKVDKKRVHSNKILFLDRLKSYEEHNPERTSVTLFITGDYEKLEDPEELPWHFTRRLTAADVLTVLGDFGKRQGTVCYVCGPPSMTDELVRFLNSLDGLEASRVLCEKWW